MAEKIKSALPPDLDLGGGWVVEWDAVDPATGATVPGVIISKTSLLVPGDYGGGGGIEAATPYLLVPGPGDSSGLQFGGQVGGTVPPPPTTGGTPTPPVPSPPLEVAPTLGSVWTQDATEAALLPNSAQLVAAAVGTASSPGYFGPLAYFFPEVGRVTVAPGNPNTYKIDTALTNVGHFVNPVYVTNGAKTGLSNDGHLAVVDNDRGLWHDFDLSHQLLSGEIKTWAGGVSMRQGATQVPDRLSGHTGQSATAAGFPLLQGVVTIREVEAGVIPHALAFSAANIGPKPPGGNPYPAVSWAQGYTSGNDPPGSSIAGHIPLGTRMRVDPSADISSLHGFEHMAMLALQRFGMNCRDRGSSLTFHGVDPDGGGASFAAWRAAGVNLGPTGVLHFSAAFVSILRAHLQAIVPPSH